MTLCNGAEHGPVRRKLHAFLGQSLFVQGWFVPVWLMLGLARAAICLVSFRRIARGLGRDAGLAPWVPLASARAEARALEISRVVRMAARYTPWRSDCYPQAVVARGLLGLFGLPYMLYFGLRRGAEGGAEGGMEAHAWIACGRIPVTGGDGFARFTVVRQYKSASLDGPPA
jgi:hypothetical protein